MRKAKGLLFFLLLMIGSESIFCQEIEAKAAENIKFTQYIQSEKTYNLTKFLKNTEENSLTLKSIPKSSKIRWKTNNSCLRIKNGKLSVKKNGTYKMYAVKGDEKYVIQITAVSSELEKIRINEVKSIEIKETLVGKKIITDRAVIKDICSRINSVKWKFSYSNSNKQKFGSTYSITFYLKSGKDRSYTVRKTMFQSQGYYSSVPKLNIFDYIDGLYKNLL